MGTENATVTATFTEDSKYNITYKANYEGSTDDDVVVSNYDGESMTIAPYSTFNRTGYAITSWNTQEDGNGTTYSAGDSYTMTTAGLTLYAQWEVSNYVDDVLNYEFTGISGTNYAEWSGKTGTSGTVYAGQSGGQYSSIQLRSNNSNSGVITTATGGLAKKVVVSWNSNTDNGRTLNVYGKSTAYSAATDLYNSSNQGTLLGTIVKGTSTELTISSDYAFIGMRSNSGAMYLDEIKITWELDNDPAVTTSITINDENLNNDVSNNTNTNGGSLSATVYDDQNAAINGAIVTWESSNTGVATINATTGAVTLVAVGTTTITAHYAGITNQYKPSENTFTLNVVDSYASGGLNNPYTVSQAIDAVDNSGNVTGVYVTGIVSDVDYYSNSNHYITYFISEDGTTTSDQLEAFHGKGIGGADFSSIDDIQTGDVVVICGDLTLYNSTTYELTEGNHLVSLVRKTIAVTPDAIDAPAAGASGSLSITTENMTITDLEEFGVEYFDGTGAPISNPGWVTFGTFTGSGNSFSVTYTISETTVARATYFKVYTVTDEVHSNLITVTQAAPVSVEYYQYSINGVEQAMVQVNSGTEITLPSTVDGVPSGFTFAGWTTDANDVTSILAPGSSYQVDATVEFFAVYSKTISGTPITSYNKVNTISEGQYLIVYENGNVAFDGGRTNGDSDKIDASENTIDVTITSGSIASTSVTDAAVFNIALKENETDIYTIRSASGFYIGKTANSNGLDVNETTQYTNSIEFDASGNAVITASGNCTLRYNSSSDQLRFRYYKSGQQAIQLYKKETTTPTSTSYYTRVFLNETASAPIDITGPSIIPSGYTLNMGNNDLTNSYDATKLIIEDGAQLKTPSAVYATVEKNITGYGEANANTNKGYYLISAPADKYLYVANDNDDVDAYHFDAFHEGEEWQNFKLATGAWHIAAGNAVLYASKNDCTLSLDGYGIVYNTPNPGANIVYNKVPATNVNKSVDVALNSGKTFEGWNLIGNPYTCTAYLADGTQDFYRMNSTGDAIVLAASNERAIDVCEGIFVHCNATGTVTFTTTDPTVTSTGNNNGMVNISVAQVVNSRDAQPSADYARIRVNNGKDMTKFVFNENTSRVYIPQGNKDYAVVRSEARGEMPVNFKAAETGTYTINVETENLDVNYLHLIDNMTGLDVDLLATPSYTFEGKKSDYASRFKLVFSANDGNNEVVEDFAFISDGNIIILNEGEATLQVIDIMGRVISTQTVNGNASVNNVGTAGVYVLQLINGNNVKTQKIVVR